MNSLSYIFKVLHHSMDCEPIGTKLVILSLSTVNSEIFARILFSRIELKCIFATLNIRDQGIIYLYN